VLLDYLPPELLLSSTITAGGDTPCHYPTLDYFYTHLLPQLRFHGWYPGSYLGHPLLLYYFPFPFLLMAALTPITGMPVAFKLGTALGVFLLPLLAYAAFRLMGFRFPGPLLGAGAATFFLLLEDNPIWGGTIASTLTGEFSYTYGIGFALVFLGLTYRCYSKGARPWLPAAMLALTALAHGYAVLWAGLSATYFLYTARRPLRTLLWLAGVAVGAFALAGFWILPLLSDWRWTTPYDDPWITVTTWNLLPTYLWAPFAFAIAGLFGTLLLARRLGGPDHRLLFLLHAGLVAAALAAAGPALGIIDVRFVPFAQLAVCLAGAAALALVLQGFAAPDLVGLGVLLFIVLGADAHSRLVRTWIEWNYTGLESKELWPAFRELTQRLHGEVSDPRVAVEYSQEHEKAGSIRMYESLAYFSGRSTLEGVYNQASLQTHPVYFLASELNALSPNPFRSREYSSFDTDNALRHLRLFGTREIVALSGKLIAALEARSDVEPLFKVPPYAVFRLVDPGPGYVEPLAFAPVRSSRRGWRDKAYRWFTRKPQTPVHLVFSDDPQFTVAEPDEWLAPPAVPLPPGVEVRSTVAAESITIHTSRPGHPLLVKVSYHPRWRAVGADGPFLVAPALMMVIPRQPDVRLEYGRNASDVAGTALSFGAAGLIALGAWRARRKARAQRAQPAVVPAYVLAPNACELERPPRRWGGVIPAGLILVLACGRWLTKDVSAEAATRAAELYARASRAYSLELWDDAAEYARHALARATGTNLAPELRCLRGESLLRAGRAAEAAADFDAVIREHAGSPYVPQALFGVVQARSAAGDGAAAAGARERLLSEFGSTPWADRVRDAPDRSGAARPAPGRSGTGRAGRS
jgi:hypothetical protein